MRSRQENRLDRQLQQLTYPKVLVLDEMGYLPMTREEASLFFRLINRRYERASTILTSNKSFMDWGEIFGDQVIATAILDRLLLMKLRRQVKPRDAHGFRKEARRLVRRYGLASEAYPELLQLAATLTDLGWTVEPATPTPKGTRLDVIVPTL